MAKKNDNAEDEWFDDEEEEKKPKKKGGIKKKKKAGILWWVVAFIVILALLLFIRFKYTSPAEDVAVNPDDDGLTPPADEIEERVVPEPEDDLDEADIYEAPKYTGPDVVSEDELEAVRGVIDTTEYPELFSNLQCNYDYDSGFRYISLRIYNVLDEDIKISPRGVYKGYNTYFMIRGIVDTDPGCDTELLNPGEFTECTRIGFDTSTYSNVEGINRISVQVPGKTEALLVECPEAPAVDEE